MNKEVNSIRAIRCKVDCVLFSFEDSKLEVFLVSENEGKEWSFLNDEIDHRKALDEIVRDLVNCNTGVREFFFEQLGTKTGFDIKLNEPSISTTYYALITKEDCDSRLIENNRGRWFPIQDLPILKSNQFEFIQIALNNIKIQGMISPIVFELLPEKFTLKQVQEVYEQICFKEFDKRNFIKKILTCFFIIKLNEKDKTVSRKGAYLHKIDRTQINSMNSFYLNLL